MSNFNAMNRRRFMAKAGAVVAGTAVFKPGWAGQAGQSVQAAPVVPSGPPIKLGLIGCGGRGSWISGLFKRHGGYEIVAGADYFPDRLAEFGPKFGLPGSRLYSGLSGYKRLLESGVDAVAIESPPYFHPEQAAAAVDAGVHVYLAKPAAVDAPGCRSIVASGRKATEKKLAFIVDFQTRTNAFFREALDRVHRGELGEIVFAEAVYHADCPFEEHYDLLRAKPNDAEAKLRAWGLDRALSGDMITEQDIHALDVASWVMGVPPVSAVGTGGIKARPRIGSCWDHFIVQYAYPGVQGSRHGRGDQKPGLRLEGRAGDDLWRPSSHSGRVLLSRRRHSGHIPGRRRGQYCRVPRLDPGGRFPQSERWFQQSEHPGYPPGPQDGDRGPGCDLGRVREGRRETDARPQGVEGLKP
jgi:predicted dehydrogenase